VRAGNTGISAIVDPYGRVSAQLDMFQPLTAVGEVRLLTGRTIYTQMGDIAGLVSIAIAAAIAAAAWRYRRQDSISA
jgi:apolipoprotein N-acyltransferase